MNTPSYFKSWSAEWEWVARAMLLFILLSGLTQFTLFGLVNNYMLSYFDAQPEDVSFSTNISYAAIIGGLPMQARFLQYFEIRNYLLTVIMLGIGLSILTFHTTDIHVFMACRFFNGFIINGTVLSSLRLIMSRLKPQYAPVGFSVFYGALLGSGFSSGSLVYFVTDNMDWRNVYLYLLMIQLTSLVLVLLLVRAKTGMRPYPLYQLDWSSLILLLTTLVAWAYTLIYGGKYYWLSDWRIRVSLTMAICSLVLMIYRQTIMKRPYVHPVVLRFRKVIFGVLLLAVYFGIKDSINLVYQYVVQVLHWETKDLILLSACNIIGLVTAMFAAAKMILSRKFSTTVFLIIGFSLLLAFNLWAYYTFSTDLSFGDLAVPVVLQG
ncbi:MAG TPA: MFS transporter, partial [Puia sp.]|nr:MFS transporter [Puia sp.]